MVFGARKKSLGHAVKKMWSDMYDAPVVTVGITDDEDIKMFYEDANELAAVLEEHRPTRIVVTTGMNEPRHYDGKEEDFEYWMLEHFRINCYLPMHVLMTWIDWAFENGAGYEDLAGAHFVAISSNSAHIARSQSMAYNASKAALSQSLRSAARDIGKAEIGMSVYGYEPGLIKGTPMSAERSGTRMLGPGLAEGLSRRTLAGQIVYNLAFGGAEQNGVLYRVDAGEQ